ncbi:MAG: hypothetical protein HYZ53_21815 [Planctomycetes bacterium]|nr:hypothetical protein [Planctomycetota bacterium]
MLALGFALGVKFFFAAQDGEEAKQRAYATFAVGPEATYLHGLVDRYHDDCFRSCYSLGSRHRPSSFDSARYFRQMEQKLVAQMRADGKLAAWRSDVDADTDGDGRR